MKSAVVSLSGGIDSTTALYWALGVYQEVVAIGFTYPSKHNTYENSAARRIAKVAGVEYENINVNDIFRFMKSNLLKEGGPIPQAAYDKDTMDLTVVPGRNSVFSSVLLGVAQSWKYNDIVLGIHYGDHNLYPDCRPGWFEAMSSVVNEASDGEVELTAPFLMMSKAKIVKQGLEMNVPYELTRSCYNNKMIACGTCGTCIERLAAFAAAGVHDPIEYEGSEMDDPWRL